MSPESLVPALPLAPLADDVRRIGLGVLLDALPIAAVIAGFQGLVLRRRPPHLGRVAAGAVLVLVGLVLFRLSMERTLIPLAGRMAERLAAPAAASAAGAALAVGDGLLAPGPRLGALYAFAAAIGFATAFVEPALIAVAERVEDLTGGGVRPLALRLVVAGGVATGLVLGTLRIVTGLPLRWALAALVALIALLAALAPRRLAPLAFDCGALATSVVTVPMLAAFAVAVARTVPGRDPLTDGFGVVVFALLLPVVSVLAYATVLTRRARRAPITAPH